MAEDSSNYAKWERNKSGGGCLKWKQECLIGNFLSKNDVNKIWRQQNEKMHFLLCSKMLVVVLQHVHLNPDLKVSSRIFLEIWNHIFLTEVIFLNFFKLTQGNIKELKIWLEKWIKFCEDQKLEKIVEPQMI